MADTVRNLLEQMLPEMDELEQIGYFSRAELKSILHRRAQFEYLLKRKTVLKADVLRYIKYEHCLEQLRRLREGSLPSTDQQGSARACIVRRLHFIFERATRKFKGDLSFWLGWLQFCKDSGSNKRFSKVAAKALRLHPSEAGLWTLVAVWEWEANQNVTAARTLMQRGLRACPKSASLWLDYFQLELLFAAQLTEQRRAVGLPIDGLDASPDQLAATERAGEGPSSEDGWELRARCCTQGADAGELSPEAYTQEAVARAAGCVDEDMLLEESQTLLQVGRAAPACHAAEEACRRLPTSLRLWQQRLVLAARVGDPGSERGTRVLAATVEAAGAVASDCAPEVWRLGLKLTLQLQAPLQPLVAQLTQALSSTAAAAGSFGPVAAEMVAAVHQSEGLPAARRAYAPLLSQCPALQDLHLTVLRLELAQSPPDRLPDASTRGLFEAAIAAHGSESTELWLDYCRFQKHCGEGIGDLHWRAAGMLRDPAQFLQQSASTTV
ncbi:hypothetical protein WJX73_006936 [Symbiochloris irregularis]|uniref:U3 small nucleolar RNA-associated protein 6 n=1 Tax=Symbiochloris irregularis TaxID=706552 RepID=A0AAW1NXZ4_9CHLO